MSHYQQQPQGRKPAPSWLTTTIMSTAGLGPSQSLLPGTAPQGASMPSSVSAHLPLSAALPAPGITHTSLGFNNLHQPPQPVGIPQQQGGAIVSLASIASPSMQSVSYPTSHLLQAALHQPPPPPPPPQNHAINHPAHMQPPQSLLSMQPLQPPPQLHQSPHHALQTSIMNMIPPPPPQPSLIPPPPTTITRQPQQKQQQRVVTGIVTKLFDSYGLINDEIFFQFSVCKDSVPKKSDRVLVEATYQPISSYKWNAVRVQVIPQAVSNASLISSGLIQTRFSSSLPVSLSATPPARASSVISNRRVMPPMRQDVGPRRDRDRSPIRVKRERSKSRSRSKSPRPRSPPRRSKQMKGISSASRYIVNIPKYDLENRVLTVSDLRRRYNSMYIPSDLFHVSPKWVDVFPPNKPLDIHKPVRFHIMPKDSKLPHSPEVIDANPTDNNHKYSAKVMLLSSCSRESMFDRSCNSGLTTNGHPLHPSRLISFLVGVRNKSEVMALGGAWSPKLDGPNPEKDPQVLVRTAIRNVRALTDIDLSGCTRWYRFCEVKYIRQEGKHQGDKVETTVIFIPDVWSALPGYLDWKDIREKYKKINVNETADVSAEPEVMEVSVKKEEEEKDEEDVDLEVEEEEKKAVPTHFSQLDPKNMKVCDLRLELEMRELSSKGLKSQLIARLTKQIKTEEENEEAEEKSASEKAENEAESKEIADNKKGMNDNNVEENENSKNKDASKTVLKTKEIDEYVLPEEPCVIVHPSSTAKSGKFNCRVMSLSLLLDYRSDDAKEYSVEVALFAELFNEMLMRDFGYKIYQALVAMPELPKTDEKKNKNKDVKDNKEKESNAESDLENGTKSTSEETSDKHTKQQTESKDEDKSKTDIKLSKNTDDSEEGDTSGSTVVNPELLLAFVYFDAGHSNYLLEKDVEQILNTLDLQLSRSQMKRLLSKVVSKERDMLNYTRLTNSAKLTPGQHLDLIELPFGNKKHLVRDISDGAPSSVIDEHSIVNVKTLIDRQEKSEKMCRDLENQVRHVENQMTRAQGSLERSEENAQDLQQKVTTLEECLAKEKDKTQILQARNDQQNSAQKHIREVVGSFVNSYIHLTEPLGMFEADAISHLHKVFPDSDLTKDSLSVQNGK